MIYSMTGYGRAEALLEGGKLTVELRSVNGKSADISIKSQLLPREREIQIRKKLAEKLQRGTIDMFLTLETAGGCPGVINTGVALGYLEQIKSFQKNAGLAQPVDPASSAIIVGDILQLPDVLETRQKDVISEDNWPAVEKAIDEAIASLVEYRRREGVALYADVTSRVTEILSLYDRIESLEPERIRAVRERIVNAARETGVQLDQGRFEQEMIFYLEKYDINEEKVRLRQHCKYFMDTIDGDECPGKKLGFIIQEMGREINTTGSKANDASIQMLVVKMKDELEKIREQSMNIL